MEGARVPPPEDSPEHIVLTQLALEMEKSRLFSLERVRDLLFDARSIDDESFAAVPMTLAKGVRLPTGSVTYHRQSGVFEAAAPMEGLCVRLLDDVDEAVVLCTRSRHQLWRLMRALLRSLECGADHLGMLFSGEVDVRRRDGSVSTVMMALSPANPWDLRLGDDVLDLSNTSEVTMSMDCEPALALCVDVRVHAVDGSLGASSLCVVLKGSGQSVSCRCGADAAQAWPEKLQFDASEEDLGDDAQGVHVFLFELKNNVLLGERFLSLAALLELQLPVCADSVVDGKVVPATLPLDTVTSLLVFGLEAKGLPVMEGLYGVFAVCSFYQPHSNAAFQEFRSAPSDGAQDVCFSDVSFELSSAAGLYRASFVRIRLFGDNDSDSSVLLGEAFVPIADFHAEERRRRYQLSDCAAECMPGNGFTPAVLSLTLARRRLESDCAYTVTLLSRGSRSNEHKTRWLADCLPVLGLHQWHVPAVTLCAYPDYDSLVLAEVGADADEMDEDQLGMQGGLNKYNTEQRESSSGGLLTLFYFENQRRQVRAPFEWGRRHLIRSDPPPLSDEGGLREYLFEERAPAGYEWSGEAEVDMR